VEAAVGFASDICFEIMVCTACDIINRGMQMHVQLCNVPTVVRWVANCMNKIANRFRQR
jgi:hypothetical protein